MLITVLGSGTSHGVPLINCNCPVCTSKDSKDNRTRTSVHISENGTSILIDTSTDFRQQILREKIKEIDAILLTHPHADHIHGLDDIRPFTFAKTIPVYGNKWTIDEVKKRFAYIFQETQKGGGKPKIKLHTIYDDNIKEGSTLNFGMINIRPIPLKHGNTNVLGYRIKNFAYLTDCNYISDSSLLLLNGVTHLIIDALRTKKHPTHFNFEEAIEVSHKIGAKKTWFTHLCHDKSNKQLEQTLPNNVAPAFDGLKIII